MTEKENSELLIVKSRLKSEKGWTDLMIKKFLPNPDLTKPNPMFRCASEMKLYSLKRVEDIEKTEEFQHYKNQALKSKKASEKSIETKRKKVLAWLNRSKINVPIIEKDKLIELAVEHYNQMQVERCLSGMSSSDKIATNKSDYNFLKRISVNYLRHCMTDYDDYLQKMYGKVGINDVYILIREKIFKEISSKYPWLKQECDRQNSN